MIHKQRSTVKAPQAPFQPTHSYKFTKMLSLSLLVCSSVGVGVFDFWLILWCDRVWVCLIFGWFCGVSELWWWWWWLAVLGCNGSVWWCWVAVMWVVVLGSCGWRWGLSIAEIMSWREKVSGEQRMWGERNNIKIIYRRATITVHICTVTIALVYLYTILHPLMCVFFVKIYKMNYFLYFARFCNHWCGCS